MRNNFFLYIIFIQVIFSIEVNVLTYNIHGLPPIFTRDKPKERIPDILNRSKNFDIILLQENWIFSNEEIAEKLDGYEIIVSNKSKFKNPIKWLLNPNGSGLSIATKDNIIVSNLHEHSFESCSGWLFRMNDCIATKGFQRMSIQIDGERVDIYNTHLDAGESEKDIRVREEQLHSLKNYIELNSSSYPLIIAGDINFNLSDHSSKEIINGFISDLNLEMVDWSINSLDKVLVDDYLFYRESDTMEILLISGGGDQGLSGLSDHPPIGAVFDIRKK